MTQPPPNEAYSSNYMEYYASITPHPRLPYFRSNTTEQSELDDNLPDTAIPSLPSQTTLNSPQIQSQFTQINQLPSELLPDWNYTEPNIDARSYITPDRQTDTQSIMDYRLNQLETILQSDYIQNNIIPSSDLPTFSFGSVLDTRYQQSTDMLTTISPALLSNNPMPSPPANTDTPESIVSALFSESRQSTPEVQSFPVIDPPKQKLVTLKIPNKIKRQPKVTLKISNKSKPKPKPKSKPTTLDDNIVPIKRRRGRPRKKIQAEIQPRQQKHQKIEIAILPVPPGLRPIIGEACSPTDTITVAPAKRNQHASPSAAQNHDAHLVEKKIAEELMEPEPLQPVSRPRMWVGLAFAVGTAAVYEASRFL
ncbi:hypothetical protein V1512DRAFT_259785 [Lipomyces arxii]|uniref:uncharacterized protein n=1 Tax=Lipomyces arxii TaxID=56418 RepID=UPI0034CE479C